MNPTLTISADELGLVGVQFDRWDGSQPQYKWTVEIGGRVYSGTDLRMGSRTTLCAAEALATLLGFLAAFAESVDYTHRTGIEGDNLDLFPEELRDWAYEVGSDQFSMLADDLGGGE